MRPPNSKALQTIQSAQDVLGRLQMEYLNWQPEFKALALAWEATRLAWYVVSQDPDSAASKLERVKEALGDYEQHLASHTKRQVGTSQQNGSQTTPQA